MDARLLAAAATVVVLAVAGMVLGGTSVASVSATGVVAHVEDGDDLRLTNGKRIRLLQIDTPEFPGRECYGRAARAALARLAPVGARVTLASDPRLDRVDEHGRLLRYVKFAGVNVNIRLVLVGAATPYFDRGQRGRYASRLVAAVTRARAAKRGLWRACPSTRLNVLEPVRTGTSGRS